MDETIEYVLLKIEEAYYGENTNLRFSNKSCMQDEGLRCNCLTGIAINYAGYLTCICRKIEGWEGRFYMDGGHLGHMGAECKGKSPLPPVMREEPRVSRYYLDGKLRICEKQARGKQARIPFRTYPGLEGLNEKIRDVDGVMRAIYEEKDNIHYCYQLKFWISFLKIMRVYSLEESSKALLAMAIFMFPGKTLKCVHKAVDVAVENIKMKSQLKKIAHFLKGYSEFLKRLKAAGDDNISFYDFCREYKEFTGIEIGYCIEEFVTNEKVLDGRDVLREILCKAMKGNLTAREKRGSLDKVIKTLKKYGY